MCAQSRLLPRAPRPTTSTVTIAACLLSHLRPNLALVLVAHGLGAHRRLRHHRHRARRHGLDRRRRRRTSPPTPRNSRWSRPTAPAPRRTRSGPPDRSPPERCGLCRSRDPACPGNDLPGQQQQRPFGIVDQHQPVHLRTAIVIAEWLAPDAAESALAHCLLR